MKQTGLLAAVFSLPGEYGIGDFGKCCFDFIDYLSDLGFSIWQTLPMNPAGMANSPYQPLSSFAGDEIYIDLRSLYEEGLLKKLPEKVQEEGEDSEYDRIDYDKVRKTKEVFLREAYNNFKATPEYTDFISSDYIWGYAVFAALRKENAGKTPLFLKTEDNKPVDINTLLSEKVREEAQYEAFLQYIFFNQWSRVKAYAHSKNIKIMGDIPFYVGLDSSDVWMNREEFLLDGDGYPTVVAGVPPDYFSEEGQRWGNPVYDFGHMKENGFRFLNERLLFTAKLFDMIRIDHFRAFDTYWVIPADSSTAKVGEWKEAPGNEFFLQLLPKIPKTEIVAEDLGLMRPEVYELRDKFNFPGMHVVIFTFLDENFEITENMISYTGTHDNMPILAWYHEMNDWLKGDSIKKLRKTLFESKREQGVALTKAEENLDRELSIWEPSDEALTEAFIRYTLKCKSKTAIFPLQDILGLGKEARMNTPGTVGSPNWEWHLKSFKPLNERKETLKRILHE